MRLLSGFGDWHRFTSLILGMARDLNEILSELGGRKWKAKFGDRLLQARDGDWKAVAEIADYLRQDDLNRYHRVLAKELYQWLVDEGYGLYYAYLCDIMHRLDPSLPYTETDVNLLLPYCQQGGSYVFGVLVKAIQSDTELLDRYKDQVLLVFKQMTNGHPEDNWELSLWYDVLILDERMEYSAEKRNAALADMEGCIQYGNDPYVAVRYLEETVRRNQSSQESWDFGNALSVLSCSVDDQDYWFYKGLCALCVANYSEAFNSFGIGKDKRSRLARAYCLIHGMGTPVDHTVARAILKDYPDDAFALYLLAVSLFRTADHPKELPPEVTELLEESKRLGYKAAGITLGQMKLICCFSELDDEKRESILDEIRSLDLGIGYASICAVNCFFVYCRCLNRVLESFRLGSSVTGYSVEEYLRSKEIRLAKKIMGIKYNRVLPLTGYSRALMRSNVVKEPATEDYIDGLYGFNQSPILRKWAVEKALIGILFEGYCTRTDYVLQLLRNMGRSEKELLLLDIAIHILEHDELYSLRKTLGKGFLNVFGEEIKDPLIKLLRAKCCLDRSYEKEASQELRKTLRATAKVKDYLLIELRNRMIQYDSLEDKIPLIMDQSPINETNEDLLLHTVGYAFFDYNY